MNRLDHKRTPSCHPSSDRRPHLFKNRFSFVDFGPTDGFTLLETLVAIVLLAVALTVVMQQLSGAMNSGRATQDYTKAVWHAREKLAELELTQPLVPGTTRGVFSDGYRWETVVTHLASDDQTPTKNPIPLIVNLRIYWTGRTQKQLDINTVVLSRKEG